MFSKMNKQEKGGFIKGLIAGYLAAEIMPEKWNPIIYIKQMLNNKKQG